jgi:putative ATP-dependent endonuclease of OLD family
MYITTLRIKNYRSFGDPAFEITLKPFTLIIGENNAGKTNLLNAIGLIFSHDIAIFKKRVLEIDDFNYGAIRKFKKQICDTAINFDNIEFPSVMVEVTITDFSDEQLAVVGDWFTNKELTEAKITYLFSLRSDWAKKKGWIETQRERSTQKFKDKIIAGTIISDDEIMSTVDFPIENYEYVLFGGDDTTNRCDTYYLRMLKMEFLDALRDAKRELIASGDYRLLYKILNKKDHSGYLPIKTILESLEVEIKKNKNLTEIKSEVSKLLDAVSLQEKEVDNSIDFNFSSPETSEILKKIGLTYGTNPISVEKNGLGRNNLLYLSMVLSQLQGKSSNGDYTYFRVIGIEEPEAHLHPTLQSHLAENIEAINKGSNDTQLLMTSHSTHITAKLKLDNTVILFKDGAGCIQHHYILKGIDAVKESSTINYLEKYLDATKSTMLFSKKVILVEGISEQILLPILYKIHKAGVSLEKISCSIVNVNGVAFKNFLTVIKNGFFIKCLVLTDSDTGKKTENRADDLKTEFSAFSTVISIEKTTDTTFEKDLIEANKSGAGKILMLNALTKTKPNNGPAYKINIGANDIDVTTFFVEIENYKSEFAFNLLDELTKNSTGFVLPKYIQDGLTFIS